MLLDRLYRSRLQLHKWRWVGKLQFGENLALGGGSFSLLKKASVRTSEFTQVHRIQSVASMMGLLYPTSRACHQAGVLPSLANALVSAPEDPSVTFCVYDFGDAWEHAAVLRNMLFPRILSPIHMSWR